MTTARRNSPHAGTGIGAALQPGLIALVTALLTACGGAGGAGGSGVAGTNGLGDSDGGLGVRSGCNMTNAE